MHEASIIQGLLDITNKAIQEHIDKNTLLTPPRVKEIICTAGLLAGFEIETLKACFEIFSENTLCDGATLNIDIEPLDCICNECGKKFQLSNRRFFCPFCGSGEISFHGGNGLVLKEINLFCEEKNG